MSHDEEMRKISGIFLEVGEAGRQDILEKYSYMITTFFEKRSLPVEQYFDQLDKNVPYNKFLFAHTLDALVSYIYSVKKSFGEEAFAENNDVITSKG